MSGTPRIFARITKIDEEKRLVYGRATQEVVDRADEIFDYASSKPYFESWSAECYKDSGGKSLGNIREMHSNVAAGKLEDIQFDDAEKAIDIVSKVVDDGSWKKVLEGVFTGYSIGGGYAKKWADKVDGKKVTRFTAQPSEISLVDRPCVPTAKFFDVVKADGSTQQVAFKGFSEPADATSGIAGYGSGDGKKKKPKKKDDEVAAMKLRKGCEAVSSFADLIQRLKWLGDSTQWEKDYEDDDSALPGKIKGKTAELLELLAEMAIEEAGELKSNPDANALYRSDPVAGMAKFLGIDLEKAGRRNSSGDLSLIQTAHDCLGKLGAACKEVAPKGGPITDLENPTMADDANKLAKSGTEMGGTSGSPSGKEVESSNAKAAGCEDDETADERADRLKRRKAAKMAEAQKAAGLPTNGEELGALLKTTAQETAKVVTEQVVGILAKAFGIDPDKKLAAPAGGAVDAEALAKAAAAQAAQPAQKRPALYSVGKDGAATKMTDAAELAKSVDPVPGDNGEDPMRKAATLIKAVRAQGPGWYENPGAAGLAK